jgi:beta-lactamase regulating signal transducer with metallopeptidase domain
MSLLLASAVDLAVVLGAALSIVALLRRQSAALRHAILAAAVVAGIVLPLLEAIVPQWPLPFAAWTQAVATEATGLRVAVAAPVIHDVTPDTAPAAPANAIAWTSAVVALWLLGMAATSAGLAIGFVRLRRLSARATRLRDGAWYDTAAELAAGCGLRRGVAVLQSDHPSLLVTFGILRSKIVLPAGAAAWPDERRRVVLMHELAHIRRGDWVVQLTAEVLRALYWFVPLSWIVCRRLREESEYACDDAVLGAGVEPAQYATHLLAVARHAVGHPRAWASAPAVANPSTLERRIAAMLTRQRNRSPLTWRGSALALSAVIAVTIPTAAVGTDAVAEPVVRAAPARDVALPPAGVTSPAEPVGSLPQTLVPQRLARRVEAGVPPAGAPQAPPATLTGTVFDQTGAVLPGVELSMTDTQAGVRFSARTDGSGRFAFRDLVPGRYQLDAGIPGFATVSNVVTLAAGAILQRSIKLPLGTLRESLTVRCSGAQAASGFARAHVAVSRAHAREWLFGGEPPLARLRRGWNDAAAASPAAQASGMPIRVGGVIKVPRKIKDVYPQCPSSLLPADGSTIVLIARIGPDGYVKDVKPVPGGGDNATAQPEFVEAAAEAVRQWVYTPTLLNNSPVDVEFTTTIRFDR